MRRMSIRCDPGAPIYITQEDLDGFEKRQDLTLLRSQQSSNAVVQSKIKYIRDTLESLLLDKKRQEYFDNIEKGKPVNRANIATKDPRRKMHEKVGECALLIAPFFEDESSSSELIQNLVGLITNLKVATRSKVTTNVKGGHSCLLCPSNSFVNAQSLSRHVWNFHTFEHPFLCLECHKAGNGKVVVMAGREAWSRHLADYHDKLQVPNPESAKTAYCPFCAKTITPRGFFLHYKNHQSKISQPFWCPECSREKKSYWVDGGSDDWIRHLRTSHSGDWNIHGAVISGKRKREGTEMLMIKRVKTSDSPMDWTHGTLDCRTTDYRTEDWTLEDWTPEPPGEHDSEEYWVTGYNE